MTNALLTILGAVLLIIASVDAFLTIISFRGGGPITNWWIRKLWGALITIHRKRSIHRVLSLTGPALVIGVVLFWYIMFLGGWSLIFVSNPTSVMNNTDGSLTTAIERAYFTGTTISGVGYGDKVPSAFPWTLYANMAALTSTLIMSLALSYVLPVITAALEQRQLALDIRLIGKNATELLKMSWTDGNSAEMNNYWLSRYNELSKHANKHLIYPILHYFHPLSRERSTPCAILDLADATFLINASRQPKESPCPAFFTMAWSALDEYISLKKRHLVTTETNESCDKYTDHLSPKKLRDLGFTPCPPDEFQQKLSEYLQVRRELVSLIQADGWSETEEH